MKVFRFYSALHTHRPLNRTIIYYPCKRHYSSNNQPPHGTPPHQDPTAPIHPHSPSMDANVPIHPHPPPRDTTAPQQHVHFRQEKEQEQNQTERDYIMPHPIWKEDELRMIEVTHVPPKGFVEKYAYVSVWLLRKLFDLFSGYTHLPMNETRWLRRIIFLETIAGVPGMMGAMARHLSSLRTMRRDYGWIHTLLEEAENERMHLLVALELRKPSYIFRLAVLFAQGIFVNMYFFSYLVSPHYCHKFVGYLEEEAVVTYTRVLKHIDEGELKEWAHTPAPTIAKKYWKLSENATLRDVFASIRADESHHRDVNHHLSSLKKGEANPFQANQRNAQ